MSVQVMIRSGLGQVRSGRASGRMRELNVGAPMATDKNQTGESEGKVMCFAFRLSINFVDFKMGRRLESAAIVTVNLTSDLAPKAVCLPE